jgi:phenylacetate-CoA ligase
LVAFEHWRQLRSHTLPDAYFEQRAALSAAEIRDIQSRGLHDQYRLAFDRVPFYREKFTEAGLSRDAVRGLDDLHRLPFTSIDEIRANAWQRTTSERFLAEQQPGISLIHSSSGTTGGAKLFAYTGGDIAKWAANTAFMLWIAGIRKDDVVACAMPFGEFTGGGGLYLGFIALGATYVPISLGAGTAERVIAHVTGTMRLGEQALALDPLQQSNAYLALPAFIPHLFEIMHERGVARETLLLKKILTGGEPSSDALRERIRGATGVSPRDVYGLGEFYGPGNAAECSAGGCLHIISDEFIAEVIDPMTGETVPEGEVGELVLSSLHKEAMPLIRYRTGDRTRALAQGCACGLAHHRIGRVPGRIDLDDIVLPGGVTVNRTFLENLILRVDGTGAEYAVTLADHGERRGLARLHLAIEGDQARRDSIADTIARRVQVEYGHLPAVTVVDWGSLPRRQGKARRIFSPHEFAQLTRGRARVDA